MTTALVAEHWQRTGAGVPFADVLRRALAQLIPALPDKD
jgi:hypothetical protein